jgi:hypothetical protein
MIVAWVTDSSVDGTDFAWPLLDLPCTARAWLPVVVAVWWSFMAFCVATLANMGLTRDVRRECDHRHHQSLQHAGQVGGWEWVWWLLAPISVAPL